MPVYKYQGYKQDGSEIKGTVEAGGIGGIGRNRGRNRGR